MFRKYHWYSLVLGKQARICDFVSLGFILVTLFMYFVTPDRVSSTNIIVTLVVVAALQWYSMRLQNRDKRLRRREQLQRKERYTGL